MARATTSRTSARWTSPRPASGRRGFTLVELLVVIGIIVLLLGLAAPMITRAWRAGDRARTFADLQTISTALDAYRQDHGDYPRVSPPPTGIPVDYNGARMLCRALLGPGPATGTGVDPRVPDGADGPGFRVRGTQGKVYGPYLKPESFKTGDATTPNMPNPPAGRLALLDRYNRPILYYPGKGKPNIRVGSQAYVGDPTSPTTPTNALYNARDNIGGMPAAVLRRMLGDADGNGTINAAEEPAYDGPFILWSAGPDEAFGSTTLPLSKTDDITNFRQ